MNEVLFCFYDASSLIYTSCVFSVPFSGYPVLQFCGDISFSCVGGGGAVLQTHLFAATLCFVCIYIK